MANRSRRQFLEESMFAAAAAVAASVPVTVLAQPDAGSTSPNEKLGVCVMGVRGQGGAHLSAYSSRNDTEVVAVCDIDQNVGRSRAEETAKRQNGREPKFYEDIRAALDDKRVDLVSIATPNHWHSLAAIWAIQAGKHVYVEKPVSHNVSEGRRVVEAARKYNKICQTGTQCRSNPGMIAAMKYVHDGKIGKVTVARGLCYKRRNSIGPRGEYPVPAGVNYDLWLGPAPMAPVTRRSFHYDWHWQWPYGNGDLGNQGIHQMDLARWGLGEPKLSRAVISYGGRYGYEDAGDTPNTQMVIHDYGDKALVFEVRGLETPNYKGANVGVIFEGTDGYLVMHSYDTGAAFDLNGNVVQTFRGGGNHFENFLKAVRSGKHEDLNADIEEGHISSALCHTGNISYRLGERVPVAEALKRLEELKTQENVRESLARYCEHLKANSVDLAKDLIGFGPLLKFDPDSEIFVDAPANANALLTRDYRAPFVVPKAGQV